MPLRPPPETSTVTEDVFFSVDSHLLHGQLAYPETGSARMAVVIAGPHPLLGGNMRNNVVRCLGDGLAHEGLLTLRFDYRGVGRSQGPAVDIARHMAEFWQTSHAPDEMSFANDVYGAIEFIQQAVPGLPLALIGYSFGCVLLPHARQQKDSSPLVLIAPTVEKHDYDVFRSITGPLLVIASEDDFATEGHQLDAWFNSLDMPRELVRKKCDNHFFRGHEDWLNETIFRFLMSTESDDV